jgi:hypothetical protein
MKYIFASIIFLTCIVFISSKQARNIVTDGQKIPHHITLSWNGNPENSQTVSWRTDYETARNYLEYCEAVPSPFFDRAVQRIEAVSASNTTDDGKWHHHSANITGLHPNTTYSYRVGEEGCWSEWSEFSTAKGGNAEFSFLYLGDVQRDIQSLGSRILRQAILGAADSKFILFGGDMVHRGALYRENWNEFYAAAGWIFRNYPMLSTPGNHEHNNAKSGIDLSQNWYLNFSFPENGPEGHREETFFLDYNNLRLISLNLCRHRFPEDREVILRWLEDRLAEYTGDWIIVTHHFPMMTCKARTDKPNIRFPEFKALYEKYGVSLVLTGHEHLYARGNIGPELPVYVVSVAGPHQNAIYFDDWIDRCGTSLQLYQKIDITPDTLHYTSITVTGDLYDEFYVIKDLNGRNAFVPSSHLGPESLHPPADFATRYDPEIVESFQSDRDNYLKKK